MVVVLNVLLCIFINEERKIAKQTLQNYRLRIENIKNQLSFIYNFDGSRLSIKGLDKADYMCLFVPNVGCNTCKNESIDQLYRICNNLEIENSILFACSNRQEYINRLVRLHNWKGKVIPVSKEISKIFECKYPVFFVLNPENSSINNIMICTGIEEISDLYFEMLKSVFKENSKG